MTLLIAERGVNRVSISGGDYSGAVGLVAAINAANPKLGVLESADVELTSGRFITVCVLDLQFKPEPNNKSKNEVFRLRPVI